MKRTVAKELGAQVVVRTSEAVIRNALDICVNPDARWFSSACALPMFFIHYIMQSTNHQLLRLPSVSLCSVYKILKRSWSLQVMISLKKRQE